LNTGIGGSFKKMVVKHCTMQKKT